MELMNYKKYKEPELELSYWRTDSGYEVDFICGDMNTAIEVKASSRIHDKRLKGLKALKEKWKVKNCIVVCLESEARIVNKNIPLEDFSEKTMETKPFKWIGLKRFF